MPPRLRVLHVLKIFRPDFTGMGVFVERLVPVMDAVDDAVEHEMLAVDTPRPDHPHRFCSPMTRVVYLGRVGDAGSHLRRELRLWLWLIRHGWRFDVVHFHTHVDRYFLAYVILKLLGRRLVLSATLDDSLPGLLATYRPSLQPLARRLFSQFDAFLALSPKLQKETATLAPERSHYVPIGIVMPEEDARQRGACRARLGFGADDLVMVFVGGICARKDPLFLVERLATLSSIEPRLRLLVIGPILEPEHKRAMDDLAARAGIAERIHYTGEVPDASDGLRAADLMVFASKLEGFGAVVIEALSHRLPVVARALPGVNDGFVIDGETGYRFDDADEFDRAVLRLAADPGLRERLGQRGRALVEARFDMVDVARRYLALYRRPTDAPGGSEPSVGLRPASAMKAYASAVHRRFHDVAAIDRSARPLIVTTIDTEEEFDWTAPFSRDATSVRAIAEQHLAHRVFEGYGVVPTYLSTYPVVSNPDGYRPLAELLRSGACDIGAHLHPWVNPPHVEDVSVVNSFPGNLPLGLQYEKLRVLTETIGANFGVAPDTYRAGRYGIGRRSADILRSLGYRIDTSIMPNWRFSDQGGPDFMGYPTAPYWLDDAHDLLELPLSSALVGSAAGMTKVLTPWMFRTGWSRAVVAAALARAGVVERIKLTPESVTQDEARRLVRAMLASGNRIFVLIYHAPSLLPGCTPYVRTLAERDRFLGWLDSFYQFFMGELGGEAATCRQVYDRLRAADAQRRARSTEGDDARERGVPVIAPA